MGLCGGIDAKGADILASRQAALCGVDARSLAGRAYPAVVEITPILSTTFSLIPLYVRGAVV